MSALSAWWLAARPATLAAGAVPVVVGTAVAMVEGAFRFGPALAALLGAILLQVGANFANDVFDFERGTDGVDRIGPLRATQAGLIAPQHMKRGMWAAFAAATFVGVYLAWVGGWPIVALGVASIAAAYLYTGGPRPYGYLGFGDLMVFLFFGLGGVVGSAYVQALAVLPLALIAAVPVGVLATAILAVNNLRDIETDARSGKRTVAVRIGEGPSRAYYAALLATAYAVPVLLFLHQGMGGGALLPIASMPLAVQLVRRVARERGRALNACLVGTARLELIFGLLLSAGLLF